jgi:hypothetical protein
MLSGDKTRVCIFQREQYISRRMHEMLVCVIGAMMMIMAIIIIVGSGCGVYARHALGIVGMYVWCKNWSGGASPFRPLNETEMSDCVTSQVPGFF